MPDWLIAASVQYPIVVIIGLVAWYSFRKFEAKSAKDQEYERDQHAKALKSQDRKNTAIVKARDAEIRRLESVILTKIQELADAVDELKKKGK